MKKVKIVTVVPYDLYFATEVEILCHNYRKFGYSSCLQVLVYEQGPNIYKDYWDKLQERYREVEFFFYPGDHLEKLTKIYPPVIRPYCLKLHWQQFPELEKHVILYIDSDVLFTRHFDLSPYTDDDICYLSKTGYIAASYFDSKEKDVMPHRLADYQKTNILLQLTAIAGIDKQVVIDNEEVTGGCQYILKNITYDFWEELERICIQLFMKSRSINQDFFASEDRGLQSWAIGDMCGLLWLLWKRDIVTQCPETMNFAWASSPIEEYTKNVWLHNAGITKKIITIDGTEHLLFNKADIRFRSNTLTFFNIDDWGEISKDYCSYMYIKELKEITDPICKPVTIKY